MNLKTRPFIPVLLATISLGTAGAFAAAPTISAFSPASGVLYSTVTITGTNFVAPVTVSFNGIASTTVTVVSSTSVKATVPPTASTGVITVGASGGAANSASAFTVLPGVLVSPAVGPPTTVTRIYYSGFSAYEPVDLYLDTGDIALSSASATGAQSASDDSSAYAPRRPLRHGGWPPLPQFRAGELHGANELAPGRVSTQSQGQEPVRKRPFDSDRG